jgi:hypothetical protein
MLAKIFAVDGKSQARRQQRSFFFTLQIKNDY